MSEEKRTRAKNPFTTYARAKAQAERVRRAAARADDLAAKAKAAADKAAELASQKDTAEDSEREAYEALQDALAALNDSDLAEDVADDEG